MPPSPDSRRAPRGASAPPAWPLLLIPVALYVMHSSMLGSWIVDDAGISFAYARSLANGHGLVSQPGVPPVEGFTNLLWVLVLAVSMKAGLFVPWITPKLLALACVSGAFFAVFGLMTGAGRRSRWLATVSLAITALLTPFAVWCTSGLENALYAALLAALAAATIPLLARPADDSPSGGRFALASAAILMLVFCTRPDGALYFWIAPFVLGHAGAARDAGHGHADRTRAPWLLYGAAFSVLWAMLTVLRAAYFHDVFPNTFYAKGAEGSKIFAGLLNRLPLPASTAVVIVLGAAVMIGVAWCFHALGRRSARIAGGTLLAHHWPVLYLLTAVGVHLALPGDWMGEYRFATPAMLFGPAAILGIVDAGLSRIQSPRVARIGVALALLAGVTVLAVVRTGAFRRAPTISFEEVRSLSRRQAAALGPLGRKASVLTPDIGGALWEDRFFVIDYVGLIDQPLGRIVGRQPDRLRAHILDERRPDAIWLHGHWLRGLQLDSDPRFGERYVTAWEERSSPDAAPLAAFYVRRDAAVATR